ncbi:sugar phosphate isomerase/epimerase family protein [Adhaeribacter rhizoryzae]|uniref:Sugar phosphate isomerase/epimerase n=1 Tax=Adhaeribacter rhizoryzae TaxID=2607907 RepID=A0A5M6DTK9_9BACT|nr:TIM barrel protein [Adhaeribacter rhizoryzae]KAA5549619.1 sugar phosphate isomerase/epimerase [Adhaeribacter rhizoryzae]
MNDSNYSRRHFLTTLAAAGAALPFAGLAASTTPKIVAANNIQICVFSKHLHWLPYAEMAKAVKKMGFDGVDLSVRPDGHVVPERVTEDLPRAVDIIRKAGLEVPMITTAITDPADKYTEPIVKAASKAGIKYYRTGWLKYDNNLGVIKSLEKYKQQIAGLAALNQKYNIHGAYQNHTGTGVGGPVWDIWHLIKDLDPKYFGCQYDLKHATVEGANSWIHGYDLVKNHVKTVDIKDVAWQKKGDKWQAVIVPLGEGMADYKTFLGLLQRDNYAGPMSIHYEYPLGGAESGKKQISVAPEVVFTAMKRDLETLRGMLKQANL